MAGLVSLAWVPVTRYPPGATVRPMLPVMVTGFVLVGSAWLAWEAATLGRVPWRARLAIMILPLLSAGVAVAWPLRINAVNNLDMSG